MELKFNCTGSKRKELVTAIGTILGRKMAYKGAPTFAYEAEGITVDKEGTLYMDDGMDKDAADNMIRDLEGLGFTCEVPETDDRLVIEMPINGFTDTAFGNLERILEAKGAIIKKALGIESLPVEQSGEAVRFPWFNNNSAESEAKAYTHFISALCEMAKTQQRITSSPKDVGNEKYAFRCFLLRLGFIGQEYKNERKVLLSKLTGSSAFRNGSPSEEDAE